jgi:hypothetical protein
VATVLRTPWARRARCVRRSASRWQKWTFAGDHTRRADVGADAPGPLGSGYLHPRGPRSRNRWDAVHDALPARWLVGPVTRKMRK